jgi:hypothetical protein
MNQPNLEELLQLRDALAANEQNEPTIDYGHVIENDQIRELGRIVTEMASEETFVFSTT